ncbi:MAG: DUF975 family protein [Lachnospiraceae bacterium]|nr:DUF975 family protein [Lachnospiraceae bacterium]
MWNRAELKKKGKAAFKRNYWVCVLVALIIILISGDVDFQFYQDFFDDDTTYDSQIDDSLYDEEDDDYFENFAFDEDEQESVVDRVTNGIVGNNKNGNFLSNLLLTKAFSSFFGIAGIVFFVAFAISFAISLALSIFVFNVLLVGGNRFFIQNAEKPAKVKELLYGFHSNHYKNIVKIQFFKALYTFLWTLLLIIPGIVKSYEYYMVSYLIAEHPEMEMDEAFARSKEMMDGNKWDTFVLHLSFILWQTLSILTLNILGVLYVKPYVEATRAELYLVLKEKQ